MKRFILLALLATAAIGLQAMVSCSQPLESSSDPTLNPPGTRVITDTITHLDTVVVHDTTTIVDTVEIIVPDSSLIGTICSKLGHHHEKLYLMFGSQGGLHRFTFRASVSREHHSDELIIRIDKERFNWDLEESTEFTVEVDLKRDTKVRIERHESRSDEESIDVCMTIEKL